LTIDAQVPWPVPVDNVEATEVVQVGQQLLFLYAERADGRGETQVRWAPMSLNPLQFGAFREVTTRAMDPVGDGARAIVALAADSDGFIYSASSYDSGNGGGPFRSVVWRIGRMITAEDGQPQVDLSSARRLATLDGLKVESLAVRESSEHGRQLYFGTDDEHYGGILRLLPDRHPAPQASAAARVGAMKDNPELRVLLFAALRERAGWRERLLAAPAGATPAAVWRQLGLEPNEPDASIRVAINQQFASWNSPLAAGDELAFLPPISGG